MTRLGIGGETRKCEKRPIVIPHSLATVARMQTFTTEQINQAMIAEIYPLNNMNKYEGVKVQPAKVAFVKTKTEELNIQSLRPWW